jgi:hypothetical protein
LNAFEEFGTVWPDLFDVDFFFLGFLLGFLKLCAPLSSKRFLGFNWTLDDLFKLIGNLGILGLG